MEGRKRRLSRWISLFLCLILICSLFVGCVDSSKSTQQESPTPQNTEQIPSAYTTPITTEVPLPRLAWTKAFRTKDLQEEGEVASDQIAFLKVSGNGTKSVVNVFKTEVYESQPDRLPRTHFFEQYLSQEIVEELLPVLDYAISHGYSRLCLPTTRLTYGGIERSARYLKQTYRINDNKIGSLAVKNMELPDGQTLTFMLITIGGMESQGMIEQYLEGIAAAEAIVDDMPATLDEEGKMLYLYRWLTDNVRYYDYDEYAGEYYDNTDWCMTYDALVKHSTVCAGYAEALYILCNLAGIDCITIDGEIVRNQDPGMHVWNVARINGKYYQFDSTWDSELTPAEYEYYGVSRERIEELRKQYLVAFAEEYCPPCEENLLPPALSIPEDPSSPEYAIVWYYRLLNARNAKPLTLFRYFGIENADVGAEEPKDGWVKTQVDMSMLFDCLGYIMSHDQIIRFVLGYYINETEHDQRLSYRVPDKNPELTRLCALSDNGDGTWSAQVCKFLPDETLLVVYETITMVQVGTYWFVNNVE